MQKIAKNDQLLTFFRPSFDLFGGFWPILVNFAGEGDQSGLGLPYTWQISVFYIFLKKNPVFFRQKNDKKPEPNFKNQIFLFFSVKIARRAVSKLENDRIWNHEVIISANP